MASRDHHHRFARRPWRAAIATSAVALAVLVGAGACGGTDAGAPAGSTPPAGADELEGLRRDPPVDVSGVVLPEVFGDRPEQPFTMVAQPGQLLFVYFGYTNCPDLCPTTLADLRKALKQLGPDASRVDAAFVTVDPERDTAAVLPSYLGSFVDDGHAIRTEDAAALQAAEDAFLASSTITPNDDGTYEVSHTAFSSIVDERGIVVAEWPFGISPDSMANDLRILLAELDAGSTTGSRPPTGGA